MLYFSFNSNDKIIKCLSGDLDFFFHRKSVEIDIFVLSTVRVRKQYLEYSEQMKKTLVPFELS